MKKFTRLTTKLDSYFQLDVQKLLAQASYLLGGHVIGNIFSLIVAITAAHFISKETYGTYRYILSIVSFIGAFSLTGLGTAIIRSVARGYDRIFTTSFVRSLTWSLPAIVIGLATGTWYLLHGNTILGFSILIGGILFPITQSLLWYKSYLNGKKYFRAIMKTNIAYSIATSSVIVATLLTKPSIITLITVYYLSNVAIVAIISIGIKKRFAPNKETDPESGKIEHHMSLMNILDIGATQLDKIILFQVAGPIEVARFTFATLIPEQLRNVIKYIPTLSMPVFSGLSKEESRSKGLFLIKKLFILTLPTVLLYVLIAPLVFKIFFPSYSEVVRYSQFFSLILIFDGGISGTILKAQNQIKSLYWVNLSTNLLKIGLILALGYVWGIWGIILSRIATRAISFFVSYILIIKMKTQ